MLAPTFCEHRIQDDPNRPFPTSSFALTIHILLTFPGKTTFVNTLCEAEVIGHKISDNPETAHFEEGIRIKPVNVELEEDGMRIGLTIVDTPGFGENIDNEYA